MTDDEYQTLVDENTALSKDIKTGFDRVHFLFEDDVHNRFSQLIELIGALDAKLDRTADRLDRKIDQTAAETQSMIRFSHADLERRLLQHDQEITDLRGRVDRLEQKPS